MGGSSQAGDMGETTGQGNMGQGFDQNQGNLGRGFDNTGAYRMSACSLTSVAACCCMCAQRALIFHKAATQDLFHMCI